MGLGYLRSPTLFDPFLPVVTDVLIPPAGAAGRTARASSRPGEIHGKRYSHASRIDRIRTCDPMLPKHVRYQTAPQSEYSTLRSNVVSSGFAPLTFPTVRDALCWTELRNRPERVVSWRVSFRLLPFAVRLMRLA